MSPASRAELLKAGLLPLSATGAAGGVPAATFLLCSSAFAEPWLRVGVDPVSGLDGLDLPDPMLCNRSASREHPVTSAARFSVSKHTPPTSNPYEYGVPSDRIQLVLLQVVQAPAPELY